MICLSEITLLLGVIGTQEIMVLITLAIPIVLIVMLVKFLRRKNKQLNNNASVGTASEIEKYFALKEKGIITQQEFDNKKSKLLK